MFEVALLFERGYLCSSAVAYVVARCSRTTIVDVLPYEASVESERRERDGSSAGSASVGGPRRVELCWLVLLFVLVCLLSPLLGEDVNWTEPLKGNRHAGGSHPSKRRGCSCGSAKVITFYGERDRGGGVTTEEPS